MTMTKTEHPITRNPESDRLFRCQPATGDPVYIRCRLIEAPGKATFVNKVDRDVITLQLQSSITDQTGDVARDVDEAHLIMSPSRHTINLNGLAVRADDKGLDLQVLLQRVIDGLVDEEVTKAYQKARARQLVIGPLAKTVAPDEPTFTLAEVQSLRQRIAQLEQEVDSLRSAAEPTASPASA